MFIHRLRVAFANEFILLALRTFPRGKEKRDFADLVLQFSQEQTKKFEHPKKFKSERG